jgi:hypothetical protein
MNSIALAFMTLIMKTLEWHVLSLWDPPFELPSNFVNVIENQFYQKWKMLIDLHYAGALLNPDVNAKET